MAVIHFFENNTLVLSQLVNQIPSVDEDIKIKGRKGKIISVNQMENNNVHIHVIFEQVIKKQPLSKDDKKKRR